MCSRSYCSNAISSSITSPQHMANVRKISYVKTFPKVTTQVVVPENLYEEPPDLVEAMDQRHSSPAVPKMFELHNNHHPSNITKHSSLQLTPRTMARGGKRDSTFRNTLEDSVVSATSLIMAGSPYLESKFIDRSRSLEDLFIGSQEYPFENLVFEGGGSKGMAYVGALQV